MVTSPCHFKWSSRSKSLDQCRSPSPLAALRNVFWKEIWATLDLELPPPPTWFFDKWGPVCSIKNRQVAFLFFGVCNVVALFQVLLIFHSRSAACIIISVSFWWKKIKVIFKKLFQRFIWQAWRQVDEDRQDCHLSALFWASCRICNGESFEPQSPGRLFSLEWAKTRHIPQTFLSEQMVYMCLEINIKSI